MIKPINNDGITIKETLMIKSLKSTYRKIWCLYAWKKSTSSLQLLLWDIVRHSKLSILEMLGMRVHPNKNHCINLKETFMLIFMQKISFITHFFPEKFQRNRKLVFFVDLGMLSHTHINWYCRFWKCFDVYQQAKNPWRLPLDVAKIL